jgi:hypothetical protein
MPKGENANDKCATVRSDRNKPAWAELNANTRLSRRARLCGNGKKPSCKRSSADIELLTLARLCKAAGDSECTKDTTDRDASGQAIPNKENANAKCAAFLRAYMSQFEG